MTDDQAWTALFAGCDLLAPGGPEETRALAKALGLARGQRIIELGGGTGRAACQLAFEFGVEVAMVELAGGFASQARRRARRDRVDDRVTVHQADMREAADLFPPGSFDALVAEGALYLIGLEEAVRLARRLLRGPRRIGFTDVVALVPPDAMPPAVRAFWDREAPGLVLELPEKLARMRAAGIEPLGHFVFPPEAWDRYYGPVRENLAELRRRGAISPVLDAFEAEIRACCEEGGRDVVGYAGFVGRVI